MQHIKGFGLHKANSGKWHVGRQYDQTADVYLKIIAKRPRKLNDENISSIFSWKEY